MHTLHAHNNLLALCLSNDFFIFFLMIKLDLCLCGNFSNMCWSAMVFFGFLMSLNTFCNTGESATPNWIFFPFVPSISVCVHEATHLLKHFLSAVVKVLFHSHFRPNQLDWSLLFLTNSPCEPNISHYYNGWT